MLLKRTKRSLQITFEKLCCFQICATVKAITKCSVILNPIKIFLLFLSSTVFFLLQFCNGANNEAISIPVKASETFFFLLFKKCVSVLLLGRQTKPNDYPEMRFHLLIRAISAFNHQSQKEMVFDLKPKNRFSNQTALKS